MIPETKLLNPRLSKRLIAYAAFTGAGAAAAAPAEAEVVYTLRNPSFCEVYYYQKWA